MSRVGKPIAETHPEVVQWLVNKEDSKYSAGSDKKVEWLCDKGHTYITQIKSKVSKGSKCVYCSGKSVLPGFNDLLTLNPTLSEQLVDKSLASKTSPFSHKKTLWCCEKGHTWESTFASRSSGSSCLICSNKIIIPGINDLATTHPELAIQLTSPSSDTVSYGSDKVGTWVCVNGHTYTQKIGVRASKGVGCPYCSGRKRLIGINTLDVTHPELFDELADKSIVTSKGSELKTSWVCAEGHTWDAMVFNRALHGQGCPKCKKPGTSSLELEVVDFVSSLGLPIETNDRSVLGDLELDIYIPSSKFAIEFNGNYWHSEKFKDKDYHREKYQRARDNEVFLLQIWEDEWVNSKLLVKDMIKHKLGLSNRKKVFARKTTIRSIEYIDSVEFLDKYHIQGSSVGSEYLGLYLGEELVAVSVWKNVGSSVYLERYATKYSVVGGMGKLLSFVRNFYKGSKYKQIVTFADHSVSDGSLYNSLGFTLESELKPDYRYLVSGKREHKFNYRINRFKTDSNLKYVEGLTERELAQLNGLLRVWDSGKSRYVLDL